MLVNNVVYLCWIIYCYSHNVMYRYCNLPVLFTVTELGSAIKFLEVFARRTRPNCKVFISSAVVSLPFTINAFRDKMFPGSNPLTYKKSIPVKLPLFARKSCNWKKESHWNYRYLFHIPINKTISRRFRHFLSMLRNFYFTRVLCN